VLTALQCGNKRHGIFLQFILICIIRKMPNSIEKYELIEVIVWV